MAVEIDFSYLVDGDFDSIKYYRSLTPMNIESMPAPTVTGITTLTYTDTTAQKGKTYYVRFGAVKGPTEKISSEITVKTSLYLIDLPLTSDLTDFGSLGIMWTKTAGISFSADGALFQNNVDNFIQQNTYAINFNSNFKITLEFKRISSTANSPALFNNDQAGTWATGMLGLFCGGQSIGVAALRDKVYFSQSNAFSQPSSVDILNDTFHSIEFSRAGNTLTLKQDEVTVFSIAAPATPASVSDYLILGFTRVNGVDGRFNGYIRNFKLHNS